jgi:hypothetical protein
MLPRAGKAIRQSLFGIGRALYVFRPTSFGYWDTVADRLFRSALQISRVARNWAVQSPASPAVGQRQPASM